MRRALITAALAAWAGGACGTKVVDLDPYDAASRGIPPVAACIAKPAGDNLSCLYCGPNFQQQACLKCEPLGKDGCRQCAWSDSTLPGQQCQQCYGPTGTLLKDNCDLVRTDLPRD